MLTVEQVSTLSVHPLNTTSVQSILSTAILATRLPVLSYEHSVKCLWINVFNISSCFQHWSLIDVWTVSNIFLQVPINFPFGFTCSASNRAAGFEKYHHTVTYTGEKSKEITYVKSCMLHLDVHLHPEYFIFPFQLKWPFMAFLQCAVKGDPRLHPNSWNANRLRQLNLPNKIKQAWS